MKIIVDLALQTFGKWNTPKLVIIKDWRLGFLYWFLNAAVLFYVIWGIWVAKQYVVKGIPVVEMPTFWFDDFGPAFDKGARQSFCDNPNYDFWFEEDAASYWAEQGSKCLALQKAQVYSKRPMGADLMTYFIQEHVKTQECPAGTPSACGFVGGVSGRDYRDEVTLEVDGRTTCTCGKLDNYFVLGVEELTMNFQQSFSAEVPSGNSMDTYLGMYSLTKSDTYKKSIVTHVKKNCVKKDGTVTCDEDDYKVFKPGETIRMTIEELLSVAGATLDGRPEEFVDEDARPGNNKAPYRRLAGIKLIVELDYEGDASSTGEDHVVCNMKVLVNDMSWTTIANNIVYKTYGGPTGDAEFFDQYKRGIALSFKAHGTISKFDVLSLIQVLIQGFVLLGVSDFVVGIIAQYCLPESNIYKNTIREELIPQRRLARFGFNAVMLCKVFEELDRDKDHGPESKISQEEVSHAFEQHWGKEKARKISSAIFDLARMGGSLASEKDEIDVDRLIELMTTNECNLTDLETKAEELHAKENGQGGFGCFRRRGARVADEGSKQRLAGQGAAEPGQTYGASAAGEWKENA